MFLDHEVSCDYNKKLSLEKNWLSKSGLEKLVGWIVKASEIDKEAGPFHVLVLFNNILLGVFWGHFQGTSSSIWEQNMQTVFYKL